MSSDGGFFIYLKTKKKKWGGYFIMDAEKFKIIKAKEKKAKVEKSFTYVSTAGGAFLEFIEGRKLPSLEALQLKLVK